MNKITSLKIAALLLMALITGSGNAQSTSALSVLELAAKSNAVHADFKITGTGIYRDDNHLRNPNQLNAYDYNVELLSWSSNGSIHITGHYKNDKADATEKVLYEHDDEFLLNAEKKTYIRTHPDNRTDLIKNHSFHPYLLLHFLLENKNHLSFHATKTAGSYFIDYQMPAGEKWVLQIKEENYLCLSIKRSFFHYLYGDVSEEIHWNNYVKTKQGYFPTELRILNKGYEEYLFNQEIVYNSIPPFKDTTDTRIVDVPVKTEDRIISRDSIEFSKVADGLYEIKLKQTENRLLIAEFDDFLISLESSYHSKNGDLIIEFLKQQFPNKPVRYAAYSHCHTQYIGFSRSHAANGTRIIATDGNAEYIKRLCSASFALRPDKQQELKRTPEFEKLTDGSWKYKDTFNSIEVYNIESTHTVDYLVFYFPKQKIMFVGDLLRVKEAKKEPIAGRSLVFYKEVVDRLGLDVNTYYISWPLNSGVKSVVRSDEIIKP